MSDHKKPSEVIRLVPGGEIVTELNPIEELSEKWRAGTYRGNQILDLPPQRWSVPGWLPSDSLVALYAAPGVGKSFYALSLAIEAARGGEWLGQNLEPHPVLYVAAERLTTLRDRAEAWSERSEEPIPEKLLMPDFSSTPQLIDPFHVEALCSYIEAEGVKLVVLDTYAMMTQGIEENSSASVPAEALGRLRKATKGGTVLIVHHSGKDSSKGLRGSTALLAAVDLTIELSGDGGRLSATVRKSNAGAEPLPEWYEIQLVPLSPLDGESRSSAVLVPTGAPKKDPGLEMTVMEILKAEPDGLTMSQLLEAIAEMGRELKRMTLTRTALNPLLAEGLVMTKKVGRSTYYLIAE
jgi:hypothetical protein